MKKNSFARKEHLRKSDLIERVFVKGLSFKGRLINTYLLKKETDPNINRVAFIIRKNLYNKKIVLRNRFRRLLRESYRKTKHLLPRGYDIVILATGIKEDTKSNMIEQEIANVFKSRIKK